MAKGKGGKLTTYADNYLVCRDLGHAWMEDERLTKKPSEVGSYSRVLGCGRCNMSRIETLNYKGELMFRTYRRPEGYEVTKTTVAEIRMERIKRERKAAKTRA